MKLSFLQIRNILLLAVGLIAAGGAEARAGVTLSQSGKNEILDNGVVRATIDAEAGRIVSLIYQGHEMTSVAGNKRYIYFSYTTGLGNEEPGHCMFSVTKQSPELIDVSCLHLYDPAKDKNPIDVDIHYALKAGDSAIYSYALLGHKASYPAAPISEWRQVWWMPNNEFLERIYVDKVRNWEMPDAASVASVKVTGIKEIFNYSAGNWAGKDDCKYAYTANLYDLDAYGHASNKNGYGAFMVMGSHEWFNDGPTKNDLNAAGGINHIYLNAEHYDGSSFTVPAGTNWRKMYGPWLLYMNNKGNGDSDWEDAKARAATERAQWPYAWIDNVEYPTGQGRGTVSGHLAFLDALKPEVNAAGAWVGLAAPEAAAGNWQFQGQGYQYWTRADADGNFKIPAVRPGSYELYAFNRGAVGEFTKTDVTVTAGSDTPLGEVTWRIPHHGKSIAWEIGVPDRSSAEFAHGSTDWWKPYGWNDFAGQFSNPLNYDVSAKNWSTALNYAQTGYGMGATRVPWDWRIHFNLNSVPSGDATMTLAFASVYCKGMNVTVNNAAPVHLGLEGPANGGNALLRESNHAKYSVTYVTIPPGQLVAGANTITLTVTPLKWDGDHVMYDYINLELP